jgi:hypothetical protein
MKKITLRMKTTSRKDKKNYITSDYGMADYYNFYSKKYKKDTEINNISAIKYNQIIGDFNKKIAEDIIEKTKDLELPFQLGTIGVRKYKPKVQLQTDNTLINYMPVNPLATAKLWDENPEAKEKKVYIRYTNKHSSGFVFKLKYFKQKAKYKNKKIYFIKMKRTVTRPLAKNIKQGIVDAFLI